MMDKEQISQHISQRFNLELEAIREHVLEMGGKVEEQLTMAINALDEANTDMAQTVVDNDYKVNHMEVSIDEECTKIIAKRQPTASDLRLIIAIIKTITDLERIGDEAEKIARMTLHLATERELSKLPEHYASVVHLGEHVKKMLHQALDAFARLDVQAALNVATQDRKADKEYNAICRQLITYMLEDPRHISPALDVMWSARALERIGDHARNLSEYTIYLVQGKDVRHISIEDLQEKTQEK